MAHEVFFEMTNKYEDHIKLELLYIQLSLDYKGLILNVVFHHLLYSVIRNISIQIRGVPNLINWQTMLILNQNFGSAFRVFFSFNFLVFQYSVRDDYLVHGLGPNWIHPEIGLWSMVKSFTMGHRSVQDWQFLIFEIVNLSGSTYLDSMNPTYGPTGFCNPSL